MLNEKAPAYAALEKIFEDGYLVSTVSDLLNWDRQTMMPAGGVNLRGRQLGKLNEIAHSYITSGKTGDLIGRAGEESSQGLLSGWQQSNLRLMKHKYLRETALRPEQVRRLAELQALTVAKWEEARAENNFAVVKDTFGDLLSVIRDMAAARGEALSMSPYDAMVDGFDPGSTAARIDSIFAPLAATLPSLLAETIEKQKSRPQPAALDTDITPEQLLPALKDIIGKMGFDFEAGRLDLTTGHPFASGVPGDTRILSFHRNRDLLFPIVVAIHEIGHALYESGVDPAFMTQPAGRAVSMGMAMHESQALFYEKMLGRTEEFWTFAIDRMKKHMDLPAAWNAQNVLQSLTHVDRCLVRTKSDEISYSLHIILRYRIEKELIGGTLSPKDLPEAWNAAMQELLGVNPGNQLSQGCLQDIHWFDTDFGYFPAYLIGLIGAGQIFTRLQADTPQAMTGVAKGDFSAISGWLKKNIYAEAAQNPAEMLIERATGQKIDPQGFIAHLRKRYIG